MRRFNPVGYIFLFMLFLPASYLPYDHHLFSAPDVAEAASDSCNLARNTAFEQGNNTSFSNWGFGMFSGSASVSVAKHPTNASWPPISGVYKSVQSGSRAVKMHVVTPGYLYLTTTPEQTGGIPVSGSTQYVFSVRLFSANGAQAKIGIIEWNSSAVDVNQQYSAYTGGTGDWITIKWNFTTTSNTRYLSLRLQPDRDTGDFYWDDVLLYKYENSTHRCVDVRHYITQSTPGFLMCRNFYDAVRQKNVIECTDGYRDANNEFTGALSSQPQGVPTPVAAAIDQWSNNGTGGDAIGIHKMDDSNGWRCLVNVGSSCGASANANYPIQGIDIMRSLPVINAANIPTNGRTVGAYPLRNDWKAVSLYYFNPTTGAQSSLYASLKVRSFAFIADGVNFGGSLGTRNDVLVYEEEHIGNITLPANVNGGVHFERYYYIQGYGRVRIQWGEDSDCNGNAPTAEQCNGYYQGTGITGLHDAPYNIQVSGDFFVGPTQPPKNKVNWW